MRWCLLIANLLILLTLGMEQCCWSAAAGGQEASHLVCVLDDDEADAELKLGVAPENALLEWEMPVALGWHEMIRLAYAGVESPLRGAEKWNVPAGTRLHRWLCQERC